MTMFFFLSILCNILGIIFDGQYAYAGISPNTLPDAVKKRVGIGKEISLSGWVWNATMGWVSQRGTIIGEGGGTYGITKNSTEGVTGWSWSPNYGWICWGKTCTDQALDVTLYGNKKPSIGVPAIEGEPDVSIGVVQTFPLYGDGIVEGAEQCDHGNAGDDSCSNEGRGVSPVAPMKSLCGNGIKENVEVCDDGDFIDINACNSSCSGNGEGTENFCGNGKIESGEECDDGDRNTTNACKNDCTRNGHTLRQNEYAFPVSGWIKAIGLKDDGWMSLRGKVECNNCVDKGKEYGVMYDPDHKEFRGWAWSSKFGWTVFSGRTLYDTPYRYARVIFFGGVQGDEKQYDVTEYAAGSFRILISKKNGTEREYLLEKNGIVYEIKSVSEFKRKADGTVDDTTVVQVSSDLWDTVSVFDAKACQNGCDVSYGAETGKSTWKTQLLSPWIQTSGGNVFSRKGFGGSAVAFRPSSQYLLYSGGITLDQDLREGEKFELSCCTNDEVAVTKIGTSETMANTSYTDLSDGNEIKIIKQQGGIKKKSGQSILDVSLDLNSAFSGLTDREERRLKKNNSGGVEVSVVYPLYASVGRSGMTNGDTVVITRGSDGKLKKDGVEFSDSDLLKTTFSKEKRIIGALTSWTAECDDPTKTCSQVGRKSGLDTIKADALKRDTRPDITFPEKRKQGVENLSSQNVRRNTLGSLDIDKLVKLPDTGKIKNIHGYKVVSVQDESGILDVMTSGLDNTIFLKNGGDLSLGDRSTRNALVFKNGTLEKNGSGTIIVNGGNLIIYRPLQYEKSALSDLKNLASIAWIVLEKDGRGGNIIFDSCIPPASLTLKVNDISITQPVVSAVGIFFAEGIISTGKGDGSECSFTDKTDVPLYVNGMFIARKFNFERIYTGDPDLNIASEFIQDTGRAVVNTPPGLSDILKSLPAW